MILLGPHSRIVQILTQPFETLATFDTCGAQNHRACGDLRFLEDLCGTFVFVDQSTEDWSSAYSVVLGEVDYGGWWAWR
ncbi:MAG TPA: hypothetical protein VFC19_15745 [Candidatus Limnocylindrales bacterium]|nr:hypothetical protein [Candidatus Limnocylindrales bacterium]